MSLTDSKNLPGADVQQIDREIFELHNNLRKNPKILISEFLNVLNFISFLHWRAVLPRDRKKTGESDTLHLLPKSREVRIFGNRYAMTEWNKTKEGYYK